MKLLPIGLLLLLSACSAARVLTHSVNDDPVAAPSGHYRLDPHHASVTFDLDHLAYSRFVLRFDRLQAELDFHPEAPEQSRLVATIEAASIDSNVAELDTQLRAEAMLDVAHYPEIRFASTSLRRIGKQEGEMTGDLTIAGRTRPVTLEVTFNGAAPNPLSGAPTLGFSAKGAFDRADFGLLQWYPAVGNRINLRIEAEFAQQN